MRHHRGPLQAFPARHPVVTETNRTGRPGRLESPPPTIVRLAQKWGRKGTIYDAAFRAFGGIGRSLPGVVFHDDFLSPFPFLLFEATPRGWSDTSSGSFDNQALRFLSRSFKTSPGLIWSLIFYGAFWRQRRRTVRCRRDRQVYRNDQGRAVSPFDDGRTDVRKSWPGSGSGERPQGNGRRGTATGELEEGRGPSWSLRHVCHAWHSLQRKGSLTRGDVWR